MGTQHNTDGRYAVRIGGMIRNRNDENSVHSFQKPALESLDEKYQTRSRFYGSIHLAQTRDTCRPLRRMYKKPSASCQQGKQRSRPNFRRNLLLDTSTYDKGYGPYYPRLSE